MKKIGFLSLVFIMIASGFSYAGNLNIVTEKEWPPYASEEKGEIKGYAIEVLSKVFESMGTSYVVKAYPWAKSESMALTGKADAVFCASRKAKREAACHYPSEELFNSTYAFFVRAQDKDTLKYDSFDDLKGHKIGVTRAYSYTEEFLAFIKANKNYSEANSDKLNLRKLAHGKIDYFPGEVGNVTMLLKEEGLTGKIVPLQKPLTQKPYFIIFNKKKVDKAFVDKFSGALAKFKETSAFKEISSKYFAN